MHEQNNAFIATLLVDDNEISFQVVPQSQRYCLEQIRETTLFYFASYDSGPKLRSQHFDLTCGV